MWTKLTFKTSLEAKVWASENLHLKFFKTFDSNGFISIEYFTPNKLNTKN